MPDGFAQIPPGFPNLSLKYWQFRPQCGRYHLQGLNMVIKYFNYLIKWLILVECSTFVDGRARPGSVYFGKLDFKFEYWKDWGDWRQVINVTFLRKISKDYISSYFPESCNSIYKARDCVSCWLSLASKSLGRILKWQAQHVATIQRSTCIFFISSKIFTGTFLHHIASYFLDSTCPPSAWSLLSKGRPDSFCSRWVKSKQTEVMVYLCLPFLSACFLCRSTSR